MRQAGNETVDIMMLDPTTQKLCKEQRFPEGTEILHNDKRFSRKQVEDKDHLTKIIDSQMYAIIAYIAKMVTSSWLNL